MSLKYLISTGSCDIWEVDSVQTSVLVVRSFISVVFGYLANFELHVQGERDIHFGSLFSTVVCMCLSIHLLIVKDALIVFKWRNTLLFIIFLLH